MLVLNWTDTGPQSYSRAGEYARSLTDFAMTFLKKCGSMQGEELHEHRFPHAGW